MLHTHSRPPASKYVDAIARRRKEQPNEVVVYARAAQAQRSGTSSTERQLKPHHQAACPAVQTCTCAHGAASTKDGEEQHHPSPWESWKLLVSWHVHQHRRLLGWPGLCTVSQSHTVRLAGSKNQHAVVVRLGCTCVHPTFCMQLDWNASGTNHSGNLHAFCPVHQLPSPGWRIRIFSSRLWSTSKNPGQTLFFSFLENVNMHYICFYRPAGRFAPLDLLPDDYQFAQPLLLFASSLGPAAKFRSLTWQIFSENFFRSAWPLPCAWQLLQIFFLNLKVFIKE